MAEEEPDPPVPDDDYEYQLVVTAGQPKRWVRGMKKEVQAVWDRMQNVLFIGPAAFPIVSIDREVEFEGQLGAVAYGRTGPWILEVDGVMHTAWYVTVGEQEGPLVKVNPHPIKMIGHKATKA